MTELVTHLIDAPVANIFIVAGLAFLAVAVLGRVSATIDPGKGGRIAAGLLGAVLTVYGIRTHTAADAGRPEKQIPAATGSLSGTWVNDNAQTRGITRLVVDQQGDAVSVHAWGACQPHDCDWGTASGTGNDRQASIAWDQGFVLRKMDISRDAMRLRMELDSVYRDGRSPQHAREYFVKDR